MRDVGHGFGAAGDDDGGAARLDRLGAEDDGFEARGADFVDGRADGAGGEGCVDGALAGGVLAQTGWRVLGVGSGSGRADGMKGDWKDLVQDCILFI